jgi:hypothetical protein
MDSNLFGLLSVAAFVFSMDKPRRASREPLFLRAAVYHQIAAGDEQPPSDLSRFDVSGAILLPPSLGDTFGWSIAT